MSTETWAKFFRWLCWSSVREAVWVQPATLGHAGPRHWSRQSKDRIRSEPPLAAGHRPASTRHSHHTHIISWPVTLLPLSGTPQTSSHNSPANFYIIKETFPAPFPRKPFCSSQYKSFLSLLCTQIIRGIIIFAVTSCRRNISLPC